MKFSIGYQNNTSLIQAVITHRQRVMEVYFPWGDFATGRGTVMGMQEQRELELALEHFAQAEIPLNLLLNGNCYGAKSLERDFLQRIGDTVDMLGQRYPLKAVTTASPVIAHFLKVNFAQLKVRASVNMEIGTEEGMDYLLQDFDSFYLKRELNYSPDDIMKLRAFCRANGKQLLLLANSGCLNFCSARTFHDNLVAHQDEIAQRDNGAVFQSACSQYLKHPEKRRKLLRISNFIRPEDVPLYETLCDGMKLATRVSTIPAAIVHAYMDGRWRGNLLELTEPAHADAFSPMILDNDRLPKDFGRRRMACKGGCDACQWCEHTLQNALVPLG